MMIDDMTPAHNEIRFDICLAHIYPLVESGDVDLPDLIAKVRLAITEVVDKETQWKEHPGDGFVRRTGGDGLSGQALHDEVIVYDFS